VLRVRLTGPLEVQLGDERLTPPVSQRPWAVFAYLALAARAVPRGELAAQFWPDVLDQSARASLRSALWALRRTLGEDAVRVDGDRVGLGGDPWVDVTEIGRMAASGEREEALGLCRGELLEGLDDEWAIAARERHRELVISLLEQLAVAAAERGDERAALDLTRRQVERDSFDEAAHRRLIERLAAAGDRAGALRAYRLLAERLRRELGVSPSAVTRELVEQLRTDAATVAVSPRHDVGLIGRERELAALEQVWQDVIGGHGAVAVISGEAGIGKTRLATELGGLGRRTGWTVAVAAALDLGGVAPLSLWAELIRSLLGELPPAPAAAWMEDLAVLIGGRSLGSAATTVAPDLQRTRLFEAVVALIAWAAGERPLLLMLDDIHTADEPSLELAGYVARRAAALPVLIVLTRRPLPDSPAADQLEYALRSRGLLALELPLGALAAAPVAALARGVAGGLDDEQVERVVAAAEGNALLAVETARALARGVDEVAPSLRGSVRATLAPLAGEARRLIDLAAVAGRGVALAELGALGLDDADQAAADALQSGLLCWNDDRVAFGHALLRDAVYEEIPAPQRPRAHERWARALIGAEDAGAVPRPAEAARHLRIAGCYTEAVPQLARAALEARAVAALDEAAAYLEEALAIAPAGSALWLELGEVEAWRGRREPAEAAFDRAIGLLAGGDPLACARAWLAKGRAYHGPICYPLGIADCSRAALELLSQCGEHGAPERREAVTALAWAEAVGGSVEEAERLLATLEDCGGDDRATYDIGHARAFALMRRGRFVESYAPSIAASEAAARAGRPDLAYGGFANAAGAAAAAGDYDRAFEFTDRCEVILANQGLAGPQFQVLAQRSFLLRRVGRLDEARACTDAARELAERVGAADLLACAAHDAGLVSLDRREFELAVTQLSAALVQGAPIGRASTRLALAEAHVGCGELEHAAGELRECVLEPVRASDFPAALVPRLTRVQGMIALAAGDLELARRRLTEAHAGWERLRADAPAGESMIAVLADLGRPVVGLVDPEWELARVTVELEGVANAVVS
jgi:DNA-binding SARP family transcriptional activator